MSNQLHTDAPWTELQGQYLAFLYAYTTIHGRAPAEAELQRFFGLTAPSVHQMVLALERHGFITREPGAARSIELVVSPEDLPVLRRPRSDHAQPIKTPGARY